MVALRLHCMTIHANKKAHRDGRLIRQVILFTHTLPISIGFHQNSRHPRICLQKNQIRSVLTYGALERLSDHEDLY